MTKFILVTAVANADDGFLYIPMIVNISTILGISPKDGGALIVMGKDETLEVTEDFLVLAEVLGVLCARGRALNE